MRASIEEINSVQRRLKVSVPAEKVTQTFNKAYSRCQQKAKVQGFRPGKAPMHIIKKLYEHQVIDEVCDQLIKDHLFSAMEDQGLAPIASPFVEIKDAPHSDKDYEFSAVIDIMPTIALNDQHKSLAFSCKEFYTNTDSLEKELRVQRRRHAKTSTLEADTPAAKGHLAILSQTVSMEGKELEEMALKSVSVLLGEDTFFPELEAAIIGMKKGEQKAVDITLPQDFAEASLAGKSMRFHVVLNDLFAVELPELDENFAKTLNFESLEGLKQAFEQRLEEMSKQANKREFDGNLLQALADKVPFDVPPSLVDQAIDGIISEYQFRDKKDEKKALKDESLRKKLRPQAKLRAQNTLLLWEVVKAEGLKIGDEEVKEHIRKIISTNQQSEVAADSQQVSSIFKNLGENLREDLLLGKALEFLASHAQVAKTPTAM